MNRTGKFIVVFVALANGVAASAAQHPFAESGDGTQERSLRSSDVEYDRLLEKKAGLQRLSEAVHNQDTRINQAAHRLARQHRTRTFPTSAIFRNVPGVMP
jgi:hypothetical protein